MPRTRPSLSGPAARSVRRGALALAAVLAACAVGSPARAAAGTVTGRLDLPPAEKREASSARGYLDAVDNAILPVQAFSPTPFMIVALEGAAAGDAAPPPQANYELRGESFARPVIAVVRGQEVLIRNVGLMPRTLVAKEDPNLVPKGTLNVTGSKSFRIAEADKIYTIIDPSAPHLVGRIVAVATPFSANPDRDGRFMLDGVPAGTYKLRVFFLDRWLPVEVSVTVPSGSRAKTDVRVPIPADYRTVK
ncbi:MAG: hypothetical protein R3B48_27240 [Kofleriaceae bacterium]